MSVIVNPTPEFELEIGTPVVDGTPNSVLYIDSAGDLAQDNPGLVYTGTTLDIQSDGVNNPFRILDSTATEVFRFNLDGRITSTITSTSTPYVLTYNRNSAGQMVLFNSGATVGNKRWSIGIGSPNTGSNGSFAIWYDNTGSSSFGIRFTISTTGAFSFFDNLIGTNAESFSILGVNTVTGAGNIDIALAHTSSSGGLRWTSGTGSLVRVGIPTTGTNANVNSGTFNPSSGTAKCQFLDITGTINQSGTATGDYNMLHINVNETSFLGTNGYLIEAEVGASDRFTLASTGLTQWKSGSTVLAQIDASGGFVFNENSLDVDCRIEGNGDANLFYTDAGNDRVGIGTAAPATKLDVNGTGNFVGDVTVPDEAYGSGWNGSLEVPTKNAVYDKIESLNIVSGTYTPTRSAETNLDSNVTPSQAQYMRVGNTVTVSGRFTADPTLTSTPTSFELSLPVASNIGAVEDCAGVAFCGAIAGQGAEVTGSVANNTAVVSWISTDVTSQSWSYTYTYEVI